MKINRFGAYSGIIFAPVLALILSALGDDATDDKVPNGTYLANLTWHADSIQRIAGLGMLSLLLLLLHVEWLTKIVSQHSQVWSRVARAGALIATMGLALSFSMTITIAYFSANEFQNEMLREAGFIAANLPGNFFIGMAVFAGAIAILGWRGKFPKWLTVLSTVEVVLVVASTANGSPGAAAFPTLVWLFLNAIGLLFHIRKT
jgi:hypothetical protein